MIFSCMGIIKVTVENPVVNVDSQSLPFPVTHVNIYDGNMIFILHYDLLV